MTGHGGTSGGRACANRGHGGSRDLGGRRVADGRLNGDISDWNGRAECRIMAIIKGNTTASEGCNRGGGIRGVATRGVVTAMLLEIYIFFLWTSITSIFHSSFHSPSI